MVFNKNIKNIILIIGGVFLMLLIGNLFSNSSNRIYSPNTTSLLVIGLLLGALIMFLIVRLIAPKQNIVRESSHTVVESMRKVFKIVFAEGHFNELYNYEQTKKLFGLIPSTKRALVIVEAKVLVGYDFEKCVWEMDEDNHKIKLISFPQPEILSIETDYKYYNFDENIFNLLGREDLTRIQNNGKKQVELAAKKSHLPKIAADQMRTMLTEVVHSKNWQLENTEKILDSPAKSVSPAHDDL